MAQRRADEPWLALKHNYHTASLRAAQTAHPLEPVLGAFELDLNLALRLKTDLRSRKLVTEKLNE